MDVEEPDALVALQAAAEEGMEVDCEHVVGALRDGSRPFWSRAHGGARTERGHVGRENSGRR